MRNGSRAMKKLLFLGVGSALMFTMGGVGPAQADNGPHSINGGIEGSVNQISDLGAQECANCHRAHTAKASNLLKLAQPALCLNCHDGTIATTDVETGTLLCT